MIATKRIYDEPTTEDGFRVLVDRLWPRGVSKERAAFDLWLKDVAPSPGLREWFGHKPERFQEFSTRYQQELAANSAFAQLRQLAKDHPNLTLLYAAHDPKINHAKILLKLLQT